MESTEKKLRRALEELFPPPNHIELEGDKRFVGKVVSTKFKKMNSMDRINMIWDHLEKKLSPKERSKIVVMLAVTPKEDRLHSLPALMD